MKCTIFKDNFQCRHTKYQLILLLVREKKKYYFSIKKIILLSSTFWQKVNISRVVSAGTAVYYFQSWDLESLGQVI